MFSTLSTFPRSFRAAIVTEVGRVDTGIWDLCRLRVSVGCGAFKASLFPWVGPRLLFNWLSMWDFVCDSLFSACGG